MDGFLAAEFLWALDGQAVSLYDSEERIFWFITKEESVMEQLEKLSGFSSDENLLVISDK